MFKPGLFVTVRAGTAYTGTFISK